MTSLSYPSGERIIRRRGGVTIPRIWITVVFSIVIHALALWMWRYEVRFPSTGDEIGKGPLIVRIVPPPSPPRATPQAPAARETPPAPPPQAKTSPPRPKSKTAKPQPPKAAPEVLARTEPSPSAPVVPPTPPLAQPTPPATTPEPEGDLASFVEARRRAREQAAGTSSAAAPPSTEAAEDANSRATRMAAANLGSTRKPSFGSDPRKGGGVFGIERISYDSAEFTFFGWNKDIQRNSLQLIEVRKGGEPDIRIAVIRRMIAIIREQEKEDFVWESKRLGRNVLLSARPRDTRGLEDFLMREFF
jgi:hypothetical protein